MILRTLRILAPVIAASLLLSGCGMFDFADDWFSGPSKSKLKGERISVMSADETLKPDPALATTKVVLPKPYMNADWPNPGGYAANAMYHLQASGPLRKLWEVETGQGSTAHSRLTAPPVVGGGRVFVLDAAAHVYTFDARNGSVLWTKSLAPQGGDTSLVNTATFGLIGQNTSIDPTKGFGGGRGL